MSYSWAVNYLLNQYAAANNNAAVDTDIQLIKDEGVIAEN